MSKKILKASSLILLMALAPQQMMALDTDGDAILNGLDLDDDNWNFRYLRDGSFFC